MNLASTANIINYNPNQDEVAFANLMGYTGVEDSTFPIDSASVMDWTSFFQKRAGNFKIFEKSGALRERSLMFVEKIIATQWYQFSKKVPQLLCLAASKVSTNEMRHYVIQTAFEELGMRRACDIHAEMFKACAKQIGIEGATFREFEALPCTQNALSDLERSFSSSTTDAHTLGLLLGLEIPAIENIEQLIEGMSPDEDTMRELSKSKFFRIHRAVEIEHVRLTVANFLRFCSSEVEKLNFLAGVDASLNFWRDFWNGVSSEVERLNGELVRHNYGQV